MDDSKLINDVRDVIYAEGMTSKERAERIIGLVRAHDAERGAISGPRRYELPKNRDPKTLYAAWHP